MTEKRWTLKTSKLGDAICLYSVVRHIPGHAGLVFSRTFEAIFPDMALRPGGQMWTAPDAFMHLSHIHHVVDRLAETYRVPRTKLTPYLWPRPQHHGYVALCPHATSSTREWNPGNWEAVTQWLTERHIPYRWFYGLNRHPDALPFPAFLKGISQARVVLGVDSGHIHLADGFGIPTIGLYGPVASKNWGGYHSRPLALDGHAQPTTRHWPAWHLIDRISAEKVIGRLQEVLSAHP